MVTSPVVIIAGAGAVGSNLAVHLARQGFSRLRVIDFDRVEPHNLQTQVYGTGDVGAFKVEALQGEIFRGVGVEIEAVRQRLTERNAAKWLAGGVVVDGLDNHAGRLIVTEQCRVAGWPCLHIGLSADYAEVLWNEGYRVPHDPPATLSLPPTRDGTEGGEVCAVPLARSLILLAVAIAGEALTRFVVAGRRYNATLTLQDMHLDWQPLDS